MNYSYNSTVLDRISKVPTRAPAIPDLRVKRQERMNEEEQVLTEYLRTVSDPDGEAKSSDDWDRMSSDFDNYARIFANEQGDKGLFTKGGKINKNKVKSRIWEEIDNIDISDNAIAAAVQRAYRWKRNKTRQPSDVGFDVFTMAQKVAAGDPEANLIAEYDYTSGVDTTTPQGMSRYKKAKAAWDTGEGSPWIADH